MRAIVTGLVACCLVSASREAVAGGEWVVLRVERVEVAVAHADGSAWDDDTPTGETCGVLGGGDDLLPSKSWGGIVSAICQRAGGRDPTAPDLMLRFSVPNSAVYLSQVAADVLAHDFRYELLVPVQAIPPQGLSIDVVDRDAGSASGDEHLGLIRVTRRDIGHLLASESRVKTYSDDSVTRLEVSARRYRPSGRVAVKLASDHRVVRTPVSAVAGEELALRTTRVRRGVIAVIGANLHRVEIDGCVRGAVQTSGGVAVGFDDVFPLVDATAVAISVRRPSLGLWMRGAGGLPCDRKSRVVTIADVQVLSGSSLSRDAIGSLVRGRYAQGIQRCHERVRTPRRISAGRVRARFTVGPTGGVTKAHVNSSSASDSCLGEIILKWRFGAPRDVDGKPTSEDVELTLRLEEI